MEGLSLSLESHTRQDWPSTHRRAQGIAKSWQPGWGEHHHLPLDSEVMSKEASTPSTVTPGHSRDLYKSNPNVSLSSQLLPNWPMSKQTQEGTGKVELYMGPGTSLTSTTLQRNRGSALPASSHPTCLPCGYHSLGPRPRLPTHLPPWL